MKKWILVMLFCAGSIITQSVKAQQGVYSLGVTSGYAEEGIASMLNLIYHRNQSSHLQVSVWWNIAEEKTRKYTIPYEEYSLQLSYHKRIWKLNQNNTWNLFAGLGGLGGYERINKNHGEFENGALLQVNSKIIYGAFVEAHSEFHLGGDVYGTLQYNTYYHINSDLGKWLSYIGIGIRYYIL